MSRFWQILPTITTVCALAASGCSKSPENANTSTQQSWTKVDPLTQQIATRVGELYNLNAQAAHTWNINLSFADGAVQINIGQQWSITGVFYTFKDWTNHHYDSIIDVSGNGTPDVVITSPGRRRYEWDSIFPMIEETQDLMLKVLMGRLDPVIQEEETK